MRLSPVNHISTTNFNDAWYKAIREVLRNGIDITFGSSIDTKYARDSCQLIELTGDAIEQIIKRETHPQYPFKLINQYCEEFTRDHLFRYQHAAESQKFSYLYFERLANYDEMCIDQLKVMKEDLEM